MNRVRKIAEITETNDAEQSIVGWGSKPIPDRDGELIESSAWKLEQYRKNPVLMLSHDYSSPPVGKCLWVKADSNGLKFKAKFANTERGREIYELYKGGYMSGFSVGFSVNTGGSVDHPTEPKYKGIKRVYKDVDLLEISCVAIPACPDALVEQVKSGKVVNKQLKDELDHIIDLAEVFKKNLVEEQKAQLGSLEVVQKPEVTENTVRIPVGEGEHKEHTMRTIEISKKEGIQALYCVDDKEILTYIFDKEKWNMEKAKKWVEEHKKSFATAVYNEEDSEVIFLQEGNESVSVKATIVCEEVVEQKKEEENILVQTMDPEAMRKYLEENPDVLYDLLKKATPKCPADGVFGEDYGSYDECEECAFGDRCEELSGGKAVRRKPKEEGDGKKPCTKIINTDGMPSVYDLVSCLNQTLGGSLSITSERPVMVGEPTNKAPLQGNSYVVDVFPVDYPSGNFVFSVNCGGNNCYYKMDYAYDSETCSCSLVGNAEEVEQGWVSSKYQIEIEQKEAEVIQKEGRVISEKNRKLLKDCIDKMGECHGMLTGLHAATEKPEEFSNIKGEEEGDGEELEITRKEYDLSGIIEKSAEKTDEDEEGTLEIDPEELKKVLKDTYAEMVKGGMEEAVTKALKKVRGNVI